MNESGYILAIPKPLLRRGWGGLFYHLGSTSMVTDYEGNVSQSVMYAPFGEVLSEYKRGFDNDYITDYLFNGKELDEETGMYYYSQRYYDPTMPMFISRDPLEEKYPGISPYAYCANNPLRYIDPTGMTWETTEDRQTAEKVQQGVKNRYKALDKQEAEINKEIARLQGKTNWSQGKRDKKVAEQQSLLGDIAGQRKHLAELDKGITQLGNSDNIYTFNNEDRGLISITQATNGSIVINNDGSIGNKVHEITHAIQLDNGFLHFENGGAAANSFGDLHGLEIQAYGVQYSYTGMISMPNYATDRIPTNLKGINSNWLNTIKNPSTGIYPYRQR